MIDKKLLAAMKGASRGVGTIIKIRSEIIEEESSLDDILKRLKELLPTVTRQRIFTIYGLLLHYTFTVILLMCYNMYKPFYFWTKPLYSFIGLTFDFNSKSVLKN